jgi:hypothetical protein
MVLNDIGCGDCTWLNGVLPEHTDYQGYDVVEWDTWRGLRQLGWKLAVLDAVTTPVREADVTICRDVMIHLPNDMNLDLIENIRHSKGVLLATSYDSGMYGAYNRTFSNDDRQPRPTRDFRRLDLSLPPYNLRCVARVPEAHAGKYLGLWDVRKKAKADE